MKKIFFATLLLFILTSIATADSKKQTKIIFGIIPIENQKIMFSHFLPLRKYLSDQTGLNISLKIGKNYTDIMDKMGKKEIHMAFMTPTAYPLSAHKYPKAQIQPVIRFLKAGQSTYKSCIITHIDNPAETLADLRGKSFAFGSKISTSSHLIPRHMLLKAKIDADKDLSGYKYFGSHSNVANAVIHKTFYAGGVEQSIADKYIDKGLIKIIACSDPLPQFPICINNEITEQNKEKIIKALLKLNDGSVLSKAVLTAINKTFTGCEETKSSDYNVIRQMLNSLSDNTSHKIDYEELP